MSFRLAELAALVGGKLCGRAESVIDGLAGLDDAGPHELSFLGDPRYRERALASRAGALLVAAPLDGFGGEQIVVANPRRAFAALLGVLYPEPRHEPGIHQTAVVGEKAEIDPSAVVGPFVAIGPRAVVGARVIVHPFVAIGAECTVGEESILHPHVVLYPRTRLGRRVVVHAGVVLGADGFGYTEAGVGPEKVPQVGRVEVGDEVEIGANSAIDRATVGATTIGERAKIDNLVQIGHNVRIGRGAILCGQAGIAGSARLGDGVVIAGQSGVSGHLEVGAGVKVAAKSAVFSSIPAGHVVAGTPAIEVGLWRRQQALLRRLAELWRRLRRVEQAVVVTVDDEEGGDV